MGTAAKKTFIALCTLFLFSSCTEVQGRLLVMEGNFFNARSFYTQAIASYLGALTHEEIAPYAESGLASVYFALGESRIALERYRSAQMSLAELNRDHPELRFRLYYNIGIIYFDMGEYHQAAEAFRNALKIDGSRLQARRNLELSLLFAERINLQQDADITEAAGQGSGGNHPALFDYLRQMEQEQWRSREWASEDDWYGPDF